MKVWITKYALNQGVFEREVEVCLDVSDKLVRTTDGTYVDRYHKPHWHTTREAAVAQAEKMLARKIASAEKALAKLKNMKFA
jgi:hypothetical protein